jgi:hypothetical protein
MATLNKVDRARYIMDLVKDGTVADLTDYANVEKISATIGLKYAQAFWDAIGYTHPVLFEPDGETPRDPTNDELATNYLNRLRNYHKQILASTRVPSAGDTARDAETVIVDAEGTDDLNDSES